MATDDELRTMEFSFSGAMDSHGREPFSDTEIVENLNGRRDEIAWQIGREIIDLISSSSGPILREADPDRLVEVEIRFRQGSVLWEGWLTIHAALSHSYLAETVLNDAAIVGGLFALGDPLRKMIGKCIDLVVRRSLPIGPIPPQIVVRTHVLLATPVFSSAVVSQRFSDLQRQIEQIRRDSRHRWHMSIAITVIAILVALLILSYAGFTWYTHFIERIMFLSK
jgi:hypothetical protein